MNRALPSVLVSALISLGAGPVAAVTWNVNPGGTGDAPTIQAAFDAASPGDVIVLAPGTYSDSNTRFVGDGDATAVAHMSPGVSIQGSAGAAATILDGQDTHHGLVGESLGAPEIRGITFDRCRSLGNGGGVEKWGGGILLFGSSVLVRDNRFVDCVADFGLDGGGGAGGGLFLHGGSGSEVTGNLFYRCSATDLGGGLEIFLHTGALLRNNTFVENDALDKGGALMVNGSSVTIDNNIFAYNTAGTRGGAVRCVNATETGSCNLLFANTAPLEDHLSNCSGLVLNQSDNVTLAPLFCNRSMGIFTIHSGSPADPADASGCGLRGAFPVACGPVSVADASWGSIKSQYR